MPIDYGPFLNAIQVPDFVGGQARVEQIKGIRQQNALAQRQMSALDQQDQSRAALNSILAQNPGAGVNELVRGGVDPFTAQQYASQQGQLAAQDTEQDARTFALRQAKFAQLDPMLAQIEKSQDPVAMAKYLLPKAQEMGFFPDSMPVGDDPEAILQGVKRFRALAQAVMAPPEPVAPPSSFQEFALARQYPGYGDFLQQQNAAKGTSVTINQPYEKAADEALGKADATAYDQVLTDANNAGAEIDQLSTLRANPALTGPTQDFRASVLALATEFGVPVSDASLKQVTNLAAYQGAVKGLVLNRQLAQKGPQTESDAKRIEESLATTRNLREANHLILDYNMALADRKIELAEVAERYREENGSLDGFRQAQRKYVREVPLTGMNKKSGRLVFWRQYRQAMQTSNPNMSPEDIRAQWQRDYGR
jgi:hypothetical protein